MKRLAAWKNHVNVSLMSGLELENITKAWPALSRAVRVPRNESEYRQVVELLDHLTDEVGRDENHPLASLMDVLAVLIEKCEDEHVPELADVLRAVEHVKDSESIIIHPIEHEIIAEPADR